VQRPLETDHFFALFAVKKDCLSYKNHQKINTAAAITVE
jgi:hypothetical protein